MIAKFSSDILSTIAEELPKTIRDYEARYGKMPLGILAGPKEYGELWEHLIANLRPHQDYPNPFKSSLEFLGLPVRIKTSPGFELEISPDIALRKLTALSVEQF